MQKKQGLLVLPAITNIEEIINGLSTPIELTKGRYSDLEFKFINRTVSLEIADVDIKNFSNVWLSSIWRSRDLAYAVKLYLKHFKTPHTYVEKVTSKVTDQMIFALNNIPIPNTFYIDNNDITGYVKVIEEVCGYPLIIKDITGSHGKHLIYVKNRIELKREASLLSKHRKYLYQKYIANDYDWGILIANGKIVSAEKSFPVIGEFRNNCNGATEVFSAVSAIPNKIKQMALLASNSLKLNWSRVDIVVDKKTNKAFVMEVNRYPGVSSGTEEVIGARNFLESHLYPEQLVVSETVSSLNSL